jgi:hypothetical protein
MLNYNLAVTFTCIKSCLGRIGRSAEIISRMVYDKPVDYNIYLPA